ncbi:hypothetical protein Bca4012_063973 [Brassica carinata]
MDSANLVKIGNKGTRFRRQELCLRRILKVVVASIKLLQPPLSSFFTKNKTQNLNQKRDGLCMEKDKEDGMHREEYGHGRDGELGDSSRSVSRRRAASLSRGGKEVMIIYMDL